jgi:predicted NAD/FAD-dependent oxidoreductase
MNQTGKPLNPTTLYLETLRPFRCTKGLLRDLEVLLAPYLEGGRLSSPLFCAAHRWGSAFYDPAGENQGPPCASELAFAACGDFCGGAGGAADAFAAGEAAAAAVADALRPR